MATRKRLPYHKQLLTKEQQKALDAALLLARSNFNAASFARLPGVDIDAVHRRVKS